MSLPVFRGVCRQYVSYLVQLVILLYIYIYIYIYLYSPSCGVECNGCLFAHSSVLCSLWLLAYCLL